MFVGFDTSNYTTSVATYDNEIKQAKQILTVKSGERGLRQSDAVFQHTVNIPNLIEQLNFSNVQAVGVSNRPRNVDGSYMPCFLVGEAVATAVAKTNNVPLYKTSHQVGHILAALYSADKLDLINDKFIAFHLSGGTTEALLVTPDKNEIVKAQIIAQSMDLKAGQAIDRTGVMLGITFPCGKEIDRLSAFSDKTYKIKPSMKGLNCSLSGVENKAKAMFQRNESAQDISKFVLTYITSTICAMLDGIFEEYGQMPVLFSGGVSSNSMIKKTIENKYGAYFAAPEFSLDNAAGVAVYANLKLKL
jgi:N6-L-threonylcarbamoyladenine synthase